MAQGRIDRLSLKFLVSNAQAGTLIGTGGDAIRKVIELSSARVTVSNITDVYPGTHERIVLISGAPENVDVAQALMWEMIGCSTEANGDRRAVWSPSEGSGEYNDIEVVGKITIAAAAGGLVLGRGGSTFKSVSDDSGAKLQMSSKDEAMFTQERVVTISGTVYECIRATSMIVNKLGEELEQVQYVNRGTTYTSHLGPIGSGIGGSRPSSGADTRGRGRGSRGGATSSATPIPGDVSASTEITINVPDTLVGNILGRQGATMREIMALSGAKVVVSPRGTFAEGTINRIVTISGSPSNAATAHMLVTQRLQQPSTSRGSRGSAGASEDTA